MTISLEELKKINKKIDEQYIKIMPVAKRTVRKKLGDATNHSNEYIQIAEDFVGEAVANFTAGINAKAIEEEESLYYGSMLDKKKKPKTQKELDEKQTELFEAYKTEKDFIAKYIHKAVINQCNTRLTRWSDDKHGVGNELSDTRSNENPKEPAVRARQYIPIDYKGGTDSWFTENSSHLRGSLTENNVTKIDLAKAFEENNVTNEEQTLIFHLLDDYSYVEMAEKLGGLAEQYRYKLEVALAKLNLKPKDLKSK